MADNEIIKAIEYCYGSNEGDCEDCPRFKHKDGCVTMNDALAVIDRYKAEIERLEIELKAMRGAANSYKMHYEKAKSESRKEFAERLKEELENLEYNARTTRKTVPVDELRNQIKWVIREVFPQTIDNLLKEMETQVTDYIQECCDEAVEESLPVQNELRHCDFCCYLDFEDSNGAMKSYPKENYNFYAGYSKQFDVDVIDEFETENIKYCPMCGRQLRGIDNGE